MSGMELGRISAIEVALVARIETRLADLAGMGGEETRQEERGHGHSDEEQDEDDVPGDRARLVKLLEEREREAQQDHDRRSPGKMGPRRHRSISPKTISREPRLAVTSARIWPLVMKSMAWRCGNRVGR